MTLVPTLVAGEGAAEPAERHARAPPSRGGLRAEKSKRSRLFQTEPSISRTEPSISRTEPSISQTEPSSKRSHLFFVTLVLTLVATLVAGEGVAEPAERHARTPSRGGGPRQVLRPCSPPGSHIPVLIDAGYRRCSSDTYPESYVTKYTSIRRAATLAALKGGSLCAATIFRWEPCTLQGYLAHKKERLARTLP